jgi:hypothetical protein
MVALVASSELLPLGMMPLWLLGVAIAALVLPVLVVKQALSDSLGAAAERGSLLEVAARLDRHLLVLAAAVLGAALLGAAVGLPMARAGGLWSLLREAASGRAAVAGAGALLLAFVLAAMHWSLCFLLCALMGRAMHARADALGIAVLGPGDAHDVVLRPVNLRKRLQDDAVERLVAEGDLRALRPPPPRASGYSRRVSAGRADADTARRSATAAGTRGAGTSGGQFSRLAGGPRGPTAAGRAGPMGQAARGTGGGRSAGRIGCTDRKRGSNGLTARSSGMLTDLQHLPQRSPPLRHR